MYIHSHGETVNLGDFQHKEQQMVEHTALAQLAAAMSDEPAPIYQRVKQAIVSQIRE
ncbi:MAG: histidine utilization repressor, partial [Pantoea agglomerans]